MCECERLWQKWNIAYTDTHIHSFPQSLLYRLHSLPSYALFSMPHILFIILCVRFFCCRCCCCCCCWKSNTELAHIWFWIAASWYTIYEYTILLFLKLRKMRAYTDSRYFLSYRHKNLLRFFFRCCENCQSDERCQDINLFINYSSRDFEAFQA